MKPKPGSNTFYAIRVGNDGAYSTAPGTCTGSTNKVNAEDLISQHLNDEDCCKWRR